MGMKVAIGVTLGGGEEGIDWEGNGGICWWRGVGNVQYERQRERPAPTNSKRDPRTNQDVAGSRWKAPSRRLETRIRIPALSS